MTEDDDTQAHFNGRWLVQTLGTPEDGGNFELSIVREDFDHGRRSWGWFGTAKIFISGQPDGFNCVFPPCAWRHILAAAEATAAEMNQTEAVASAPRLG